MFILQFILFIAVVCGLILLYEYIKTPTKQQLEARKAAEETLIYNNLSFQKEKIYFEQFGDYINKVFQSSPRIFKAEFIARFEEDFPSLVLVCNEDYKARRL